MMKYHANMKINFLSFQFSKIQFLFQVTIKPLPNTGRGYLIYSINSKAQRKNKDDLNFEIELVAIES